MYLRGLFKVYFYSTFLFVWGWGFFLFWFVWGFSGRIINLAADFCKIVVYWIPDHLSWRGPCRKIILMGEETMLCPQCLEWLASKCNKKRKEKKKKEKKEQGKKVRSMYNSSVCIYELQPGVRLPKQYIVCYKYSHCI